MKTDIVTVLDSQNLARAGMPELPAVVVNVYDRTSDGITLDEIDRICDMTMLHPTEGSKTLINLAFAAVSGNNRRS